MHYLGLWRVCKSVYRFVSVQVQQQKQCAGNINPSLSYPRSTVSCSTLQKCTTSSVTRYVMVASSYILLAGSGRTVEQGPKQQMRRNTLWGVHGTYAKVLAVSSVSFIVLLTTWYVLQQTYGDLQPADIAPCSASSVPWFAKTSRAALTAPWNSKVTFNSTEPIPLQLWQTSRTKRLGAVAGALQKTWANKNPGMSMHLLDDAEAAASVKDFYGPEVAQLYAAYPLGVMRADFWRYAVLYARGGIYADVDTECLRPMQQWFPPWTHPREGAGSPVFTQEAEKSKGDGSAATSADASAAVPEVESSLGPVHYANLTWADCSFVAALENDVHMCQWVIVSVPGHPILRAVLHAALKSLQGGLNCAYEHMVHAHTGPGVWTEGIRDALGLPGNANAADIAKAVWTDPSVYQRAREMRACIVAADFWGGKKAQNANNRYSSSWKEGSPFGSWTKERQQLIQRTKAASDGS